MAPKPFLVILVFDVAVLPPVSFNWTDTKAGWAEMFDAASIEEKKMIAAYLIKAMTLTGTMGYRWSSTCLRHIIWAGWKWADGRIRQSTFLLRLVDFVTLPCYTCFCFA